MQLKFLITFFFILVLSGPLKLLAQTCEQSFRENSSQAGKTTDRVVLEITSRDLPAMMTGEGSGFRARLVNVHVGAATFGLHSLPGPLKHVLPKAKVDIYLIGDGGKRTTLALPRSIKSKLVEYIRNGGPPQHMLNGAPGSLFDCNSFVHFVTGVPYVYGKFTTDLWRITRIDDENPIRPGDVILIGYGEREINHVAINIGEDLYISKFGSSGPILVTDLATLQMAYGGIGILSATPKKAAAW